MDFYFLITLVISNSTSANPPYAVSIAEAYSKCLQNHRIPPFSCEIAGSYFVVGADYAGYNFYPFYTCPTGTSPGITYQNQAFCLPPALPPKTFGPPNCGVGNPCDPSTGNKYQKETDYAGNKNELSFIRHYNSGLSAIYSDIGYGWTHQGSTSLYISAETIAVRQATGRSETFSFVDGLWQGDADSHLSLTQDSNGYTLQNGQGITERYDTAGHLISRTDQFGKQTLYSYNDSGFVETVAGPFGHVLSFAYSTDDLLETVTAPGSQVYSYEYDSSRNLIKATYPDNSFRLYHYENVTFIHALTGITDENGDRYATFGYDASGKAKLTQHAQTDNGSAQEKFTLSYDSDTRTTVTDAAGTVEVLSYDEKNNLIRSIDSEGKVTEYSYNASNQKISKTEAAETPAARLTEYQYLSDQLDLLTETRSPSVKVGQYTTIIGIMIPA